MTELKKAARYAGIYFIGNVVRRLVSIIMLPVYAHYLSPEHYGVIGLLGVFFIVYAQLLGGRVAGLARFYYESEHSDARRYVMSTALLATLLASALPTILTCFFSEQLSVILLGDPKFALVVLLLALPVFTGAIEEYGFTYLRLKERPYLFVGLGLLKLVFGLGLNIWLIVFLELNVLGVAISRSMASGVFGLAFLFYLTKDVGFRFDRNLAIRLYSYSWPLWFSGLAGTYIWSSSRYFLRVIDSLDAVGIYELASKFATIFVILFWEPFSTFWNTEKFNLYRLGESERIFRIIFEFLFFLLLIGATLLGIFSTPLILFMASPVYSEAALLIPILAFAAVFSILGEFVNFGLLAADKTKVEGLNQIRVGIVITALMLWLVPAAGAVGAAVAMLLARGVQFLLSFYSALPFYDHRIKLSMFIAPLAVGIGSVGLSNYMVAESIIADLAIKCAIALVGVSLLILNWSRKDGAKSVIIPYLVNIWRDRFGRT